MTFIRRFAATARDMGVGQPETGGSFFVYDREDGEDWHMHCGPYPTLEDGKWWIEQIREEAKP